MKCACQLIHAAFGELILLHYTIWMLDSFSTVMKQQHSEPQGNGTLFTKVSYA